MNNKNLIESVTLCYLELASMNSKESERAANFIGILLDRMAGGMTEENNRLAVNGVSALNCAKRYISTARMNQLLEYFRELSYRLHRRELG